MTTAIVTLVDVGISYRLDGELWGAIAVRRQDGHTKLYAQYLPQHPYYNPPGWSAIQEITQVSAEEVLRGWDAEGRTNSVAERAFAILKEEIGKEFLAKEIEGVADERALELIPVRVEDPTVRLDLNEGLVLEGSPVRFTRVIQLSVALDPNNLAPPQLLIHTEDAPPAAITVPDIDHQPDPRDWFFVETFVGMPAVKVAHAWTEAGIQKANGQLQRAIQQLGAIVTGRYAPLTEDGQLDLAAFRRALVRERYERQRIEPFLFVGRSPKYIAQGAWTLLKDTVGSHLFRYNVERGARSGVPALIRIVDGQQKLEVLETKEEVRGVLFSFLDFCGAAKGKALRHVVPPNVISEHMILFADQSVPAIDTLVRIPTVRKDGTIHDKEGYDMKSRIWYAPELELAPIPENPTRSDVNAALATVLAPFTQFPFVEDAGSRAATVACLLDQIVRPMVTGPRPLYAFDAPALKGQGTGKTLLATAIGAIITGREIEVTAWPDDPKELPKLITSKLMTGEPFVIFDNLEGTVRHKDLAACATSTMWSSRLLHSNESPKLPQTATWCMTLNGARFSRDIARRTITIKLDSRTSDPHKRKGFRIRNLIPWCVQNRANIIRACLLLVKAWVQAGKPEDERLVAGSFEAWQSVVGGIVYHAGLTDLPLALEESRGRDVDSTEHDEFVERWAENYGPAPVTALQLAMLAESFNLYGATLEKVRSPNWKGRHMAEILRKLVGHNFRSWRVERPDTKLNGNFVYQLKPLDGPPSAEIN